MLTSEETEEFRRTGNPDRQPGADLSNQPRIGLILRLRRMAAGNRHDPRPAKNPLRRAATLPMIMTDLRWSCQWSGMKARTGSPGSPPGRLQVTPTLKKGLQPGSRGNDF